MANIQKIVRYSGTVQGVGFRYATVDAAMGYDVSGYVRNLPDGRVECLAEGPAEQVEAFLSEVAERMAGFIRDVQQQTAPFSGGYVGFKVRR